MEDFYSLNSWALARRKIIRLLEMCGAFRFCIFGWKGIQEFLSDKIYLNNYYGIK